ncbi:MAG: alpha/beta hydrolase [Acidiferrobacterales bacterium]
MEQQEPPLELLTGPKPSAAVIWLHGLGADGYDFEPVVRELGLPRGLAVRFVFPHAPFRAVTINGGHVMRAWYDIEMTETGFNQKMSHIRESEATVRQLIEREIERGIPADRMVLAGFSQGGAIALFTGLRFPQRLAGVLALSAPVPIAGNLMSHADQANTQVPIFMAHGTHDGIIPFAMGQAARNLLGAGGANIEWHEYAMEHSVCPAEIKDIGRWLGARLQP